jgi:hypothetical protein
MIVIAFFLIGFNLSMGIVNGYNFLHEADTGHPLVDYEQEQLIRDDFITTDGGKRINASDATQYNESVSGLMQFYPIKDSSAGGFMDYFGFFSFVVRGIRVLVNTVALSLFGFVFLLAEFGVPWYFLTPIASVSLLVVIISIVEILSGRQGVFS